MSAASRPPEAGQAAASPTSRPAALWQWDGVEVAEAVAAGRVSAREVVGDVVAHMRAVNPSINAVVDDLGDAALEAAAAADERQARGEPLGPLHGCP